MILPPSTQISHAASTFCDRRCLCETGKLADVDRLHHLGSNYWFRCLEDVEGPHLGFYPWDLINPSIQDEINGLAASIGWLFTKSLLMGNGWTSPFSSIKKLLFRVPGWYLHTFWKYKMLIHTAWWFVSNPFEKCAQVKLDHFPMFRG